jgi:hypothetical protein
MNAKLLSLLLFCSTLSASSAQSGNANEFIDSVLVAVKTQYGSNLDPLHLPDEEFAFNQKVGIITLKGDIKLTNGSLNGLSALHRTANSTIGTENQHFVAHLRVGDENVHFKYDVHVDLLDLLHPSFQIQGDIENIDINITIALDSDGKLAIQQFEIDELKHVRMQIHGLGVLDPIADIIADVIIEVANPQIRKSLSHLVEGMIGPMLTNFSLTGL